MRNPGNKLFQEDFSGLKDKYLSSVNQDDLRFWSNALNCEESDLLKAISHMGNNIALINDWLILNRLRKEFIYS
jgi:hypothetical protein